MTRLSYAQLSSTLLLVLLLCLWPHEAEAHGRDSSYSSWRQLDAHTLSVTLRISGRDYARFAGAPEVLASFTLPECELVRASLVERRSASGEQLLRWTYRCSPLPERVDVGLFDTLGPAHLHQLELAGRGPPQLLTAAQAGASLAESTDASVSPTRGWAAFVRLGFAHILEGWDHLAFVLTLLLAARSLGELAGLVTGFTLGHSLTLALSALGLAHPTTAAIELLIAASVLMLAAAHESSPEQAHRRGRAVALVLVLAACVAWLNGAHAPALAAAGAAVFAWAYLRRGAESRPAGHTHLARFALVGAFGLVHGAGFAGVLQLSGLPTNARLGSLLAFNVGVELGQLAFVALAWPLLALLRRRYPGCEAWIALALAGLGTAWVYARVF